VAPPSTKTVAKRLFLPHRLRQLFSSLSSYYERTNTVPSLRIGSYLHRLGAYISSREASLTSASLVPLTEGNLSTTEFDFTVACEDWARSYNLDIFNDLVAPFQTRPAPSVPVHQGEAELPLHQGNPGPLQVPAPLAPVQQAGEVIPVQQGNLVPSGQVGPPEPAQPDRLAILQDLPALEASIPPLSIGPPLETLAIEPSSELDLVIPDCSPLLQPALIPLPASPPSVEITLHDCPVEAKSTEILIPDAPSQTLALFPPKEALPYQESESSRETHSEVSSAALGRTFESLNITMSPGNPVTVPPGAQPEYNAAIADELRRLRAEMDQIRTDRLAESQELDRLRSLQVANFHALERAETQFQEESRRRQQLEDIAAHAARAPTTATGGLDSSRHAPNKGKVPALGEAGSSNWQSKPHPKGPAYSNESYQYTPQVAPPNPGFYTNPQPYFQPPPDLATNPFLRAPQQTIRAQPPPAQPAPDLLSKLTRLQTLFANSDGHEPSRLEQKARASSRAEQSRTHWGAERARSCCPTS
jgi:hypothetical protein